MAGFDGSSDPMQKTREARTSAAQSAIDRMLSFVEDDATRLELRARIDAEPRSVMQGGVEIPIVNQAQEDPEDARWEDLASKSRMAPGVPTPISPQEFELMTTLLELDEQEITIARVMLDDHLDVWSSTIDPILERAFSRKTFGVDGRADLAGTESQWSDLREALVESRRLDEAFIGELETALGREDRGPAFEAVRIQRAFDRMNSIAGSRFDNAFGIPIVEPTSPYAILAELAIDDDVRDQAMGAAIAAADELRPAVDGWEDLRFEEDRRTTMDQVRLMSRMREIESLPEDQQMAEAASLGMMRMEPMLRQLEIRRAEAARRRAVVDSVLDARIVPDLPSLAALELRITMLDSGRRGGVDEGTALDVARRVLRLRDLEESQAAIIESLFHDHLELEITLVEAMAAAAARLEAGASSDMTEMMQKQGAMQQEIEKSMFRRRELGERLLQRLLDVLNAEQIARIPALSERAGN
jgi:hypothetical protein